MKKKEIKRIMKMLEECTKASDKLERVLHDDFQDETSGVLHNTVCELARDLLMGPGFNEGVGEQENSKTGRFLSDELADEILFGFKVSKIKEIQKEARKFDLSPLEEFLKTKGVLAQYRTNCVEHSTSGYNNSEYIARAFEWSSTQEGDLFWRDLNTEYNKLREKK